MSTVNDMFEHFKNLKENGHGDKEVFYRHGASGDCGPLSNPRISNEFDECGPFDIEEGTEYVSVYTGN